MFRKFINSRVLKVSAISLLLSLQLSSCQNEDNSNSLKVVNGQKESRYPAVGSLLSKSWFSSQHTCTATLIKEDWLLTAAHCLKKGIKNLSFSIGPEAKSGKLFKLEKHISHPRYYSNPIGSLYDIALVKLKEPVPASIATPIAYSMLPIDQFQGQSVFYIGYGSTSGASAIIGLGVKRSVSVPLKRVDLVTYSNDFNGQGLCTGDSGGPGLVEVDGKLQIIGITSASLGCQGGTCDVCSNGSKHTRVDRFYDWIASEVGDDFISCKSDLGRCACDDACGANGVCDNTLCGKNSCKDITDCIFDFCGDTDEGACTTACVETGSVAAREKLLVLVGCWGSKCRAVPGSENERQCLLDNCGDQWDHCSAK